MLFAWHKGRWNSLSLAWAYLLTWLAGYYPNCCFSVHTWLQGELFVHSGVGASARATSCVLPLWLLLPPGYLTLGCVVCILWCWCFLLGLLKLVVILAIYTFVPRRIVPWYSHFCWCYCFGVLLLPCPHLTPGCIACPGVDSSAWALVLL